MPTQNDIGAGWVKINGAVYNLVKMIDGGTGQVIWPATSMYTYVIDISTFALHYAGGVNWITAIATNYCYATANVKVMRGETLVETITNAVLTATGVSGTHASHFSVNSSGYVLGNNLGTTEVNTGTAANPQGYYCTASFVYVPQEGTPSSAVTATVNQQYNIIESTSVTNVVVRSAPESSSVANTGATVKCYGTIVRTLLYTWTSTSQSQGTDNEGSLYLYVDEVYKATISHGGYYSLVIPENPYDYDIEFYVKVAYTSDTEVNHTATIEQAASVFTYDRPVIYGDCDPVPASGGTSYFVGYATQARYKNGQRFYPDLQPAITWSVASYSGVNLHKTETPQTLLGKSTATCTSHGQTAIPLTISCYQEENKRVLEYYEDERTDLEPEVESKNPSVSVGASNYTNSNAPCPAGGGNCTLQYAATADMRSRDRWRIDRTNYYTWTSGDPDSDVVTTYYNGQWSAWASTSVEPDITCNRTWSRVGLNDTVTIDSRGTNNNDQESGDGRNVVYTVSYTTTNGVTDSDTVTLYQQENRKTEPHDPVRSLEITTSGTIPASGGTFVAHYVSKETYGLYVYTSGATSGTEQTRAVTGEISCSNCNYNGSTRFNVSGEGNVTLTVPSNAGSLSSRYAVVTLDGYESDSIEQEADVPHYTFMLDYNGTPVTNNTVLHFEPGEVQTIYLTDEGTNGQQYTPTQNPYGECPFWYDSANLRFVISNIQDWTDEWFQVYEATSGVTIKFWVHVQ